MLSDEQARKEAIDPSLSAIVQAPAGSGKTEILTQRFLRLLLTVDSPEQVVALTFTRKAAFEMQARILKTLQTNQAVLTRDKALDWQLLNNPNRLRVTTLDSLCQSLTQAMPLQDKHVPYATVTDTPNKLYWKAARACINHALATPDYQKAITVLLEHLDNRTDTLLSLLTEQLAKRDQWLTPIYQARLQDKTHLEAALKKIEQHAIHQFKQALPAEYTAPLMQLASKVAHLENYPDSPRSPLKFWCTLDAFDSQHASALASLLLTTQKKFRKSFDHHVGLKRDSCAPQEYKTLKAESKALLEALKETPGFLDALLRVRALPKPTYPIEQWEPLQALLTLLPLLAGHLHLIFQATQSTDFTGVTHQALDALGAEEAPTDLALYLDYNIQHLLVDEFQDTSIQQFDLITRITRGFEPGDGRTLFVVGDPMQSIYRFRAAEVGLFLKAQQQGIGTVKLKPLYLDSNFRSNAPLVNWVNQHFSNLFPAFDDLKSGAVSFHSANPTRDLDNACDNTHIKAFEYEHTQAEATAIAELSEQLLATHPEETIAILVRARGQLPTITKALDARHLTYQGLDTDLISSLPHVKDIWSMTKALLMPTHRLAWLSLLRSPWCGLTLPDLHLIANHAPHAAIPIALDDPHCIQQLSQTGQIRINFVYNILKKALTNRHQDPLTTWIQNTLKALHLNAILTSDEIAMLEPFWDKLEQFEQDGLLSELALFEQEFNQLYAKKVQSARLQLMTIHKSKGLEFDSVILPGLGRRAPAPDKPLLRWLTLPSEASDDLILISPLNAAHNDRSDLYDYLGELDAEKNKYEQQRLLYVAATRAKKRLYLFDNSTSIIQNTFRASLKNYPFEPMVTEQLTESITSEYPKRTYLPDDFYTETKLTTPAIKPNPPSVLPELTPARALGIITHELLEWMCTHHPKTLEEIPWNLTTPALEALDLPKVDFEAAQQQIKTWVTTLFNHPRGQWIIQEHVNEHCEYALLVFENNRVNTRVIDRLFEDNGIYWIIDFKTGQNTPEQHRNHYTQLNHYAKYMAEHTHLPIHCGVYYLEDADWIEWAWESKSKSTTPYEPLLMKET
ncbi:MAG: UvrD-helicase domain-containing protein [Gammaproteobacteria bacterium]|nr:UvrD-helicase domain-containing protein [Gammaproteobacteria bacterium]